MSGNITMALTFKPDPKLPDIHHGLIAGAVDALNEYCLGEEPENLDEAIRCLRALKLYVTPTETSTAP